MRSVDIVVGDDDAKFCDDVEMFLKVCIGLFLICVLVRIDLLRAYLICRHLVLFVDVASRCSSRF